MSTLDYSMPLDFATVTNARCLIATVASITDNKITVTLNGATIPDVPNAYHCHHQHTDHAGRVFKPDDTVLCLYTGQGAGPSANNLKVIGFPAGYLRDCRMVSGILFNLDTSVLINSTLPAGEQIEKPSEAVAGNVVTCNATNGQQVSIQASSNFRYSNASGSDIYIDGVVWDSFMGTVNGAAIQGNNVVVVSTFGVYSRPINKSSFWYMILDISQYSIFGSIFYFSSDGSKAIGCDTAGNVYQIDLSGNNAIYKTETLQTTGQHTAVSALVPNSGQISYSMECCIFVDMNDDGTPIMGYLNYNRTVELTGTNTDQYGNPIVNDLPLYRTILTHDEQHNFDIYIYIINTVESATATASLVYGNTVIDLVDQNYSYDKTTYTLVQTGVSSLAEDIKEVIKFRQGKNNSKILNFDMRKNFIALYNNDSLILLTENSVHYGKEYPWYDPDSVTYSDTTGIDRGEAFTASTIFDNQDPTRRKKINDLTVSYYTDKPPLNYDISDYLLDILSNVEPRYPTNLNIIGIDPGGMPEYAKHPITNDELIAWKHDPTVLPYVKFNGSDGINLEWEGQPLIQPSTDVLPQNIRLV